VAWKSKKSKKSTKVVHPGKIRTHKVHVKKEAGSAWWKKKFLRSGKTPTGG